MPSLNDLSLNRFIKRDNRNIDPTDAGSSMFADINNNQGNASTVGNAGGNSSSSTSGQTNSVVPGSIIQSVTLQSSGSDDRIEINPDDQLLAYNDGDVVVRINKDGIDATNIVVENLDVTDEFTYAGAKQPQVFGGSIDGATGAALFLPTGWTSVRNSVGNYTITHNLASPVWYTVVATPITGHFRTRIVSFGVNSFTVTIQETVYGSASFPVSGGGGGSVTVSGVRVPPNETLVDSDFNFVLVN